MRTVIRSAAVLTLASLALAVPLPAAADQPLRSPSPKGAELYFITPHDGDVVTSPFTVRFGLKGMGVAPAGMDRENTGHHHLLINVTEPVDPLLPLPATEQVVHFGGGQTETDVSLPPGEHTLQLMLGNHLHIPHDPPVQSQTITVTVQ